ncbi:MAG: outer membrane lipid asymmetry maintenance protein MlaD [Pseudomonadota bacterium]
MASKTAETLIGAAVLAAAAGFMVYAAQTADVAVGGRNGYELKAAFREATGLRVGSDVRVAGVKVGSVASINLDNETYQAVARMTLDGAVKVPEDSDAAVATEGLMGGVYVSITPGGSDMMLADGEEILYTQGSVNLMDLVGRAISSGAGSGGE